MTLAFFLIFLIYPSTSAAILSFFQCFPVDDGHSYLRRDFSIDCDTEAHSMMRHYAVLMVAIYPLGIPVMYWALFRAHGDALKLLRSSEVLRAKMLQASEADHEHHHREVERHHQSAARVVRGEGADLVTAMAQVQTDRARSHGAGSKRFKSPQQLALEQRLAALDKEMAGTMEALPDYVRRLISGYELRCFYFEIFESFRKLALVGVPVFFEPAGGVGQLTYALLVCFITFGMYTALSPYVDDGEDRLAQLCQVQIFFTLLASLVVRTDRERTESIDMLLSTLSLTPLVVAVALESPLESIARRATWEEAASGLAGAWRCLCACLSARVLTRRSQRTASPAAHRVIARDSSGSECVESAATACMPTPQPLPTALPRATDGPGATEPKEEGAADALTAVETEAPGAPAQRQVPVSDEQRAQPPRPGSGEKASSSHRPHRVSRSSERPGSIRV